MKELKNYTYTVQDSQGNEEQYILKAFTTKAENQINSDIQAETDRAESKESELNSLITSEVSRAESKESGLNSLITSEVSRAESKESELNSLITSEVSRAESKESELQRAIDNIPGGGGLSIVYTNVNLDDMQEGLVARNNNIVGYFKRIFTDYLENIGAITKSVQYCNYDTTKRLLTYEIQLIPTDNEFGVSFKTFCDCLADYIQMSPATDKLFMTFTNLATPTLSIVTQDISFYDATHTSQRFTYTLTAYVTLSDDQLTALKNGNVIFDATGLTYMRIS